MKPEKPETLLDIWGRHYDTLDEKSKILFLLTLKQLREEGKAEAGEALVELSSRWVREKIK